MSDEPTIHPAAALFPMMDDATFAELKADIERHGQREPVVFYKQQLLDGRNRWKACHELGIRPSECELDESEDPIAYVVSANLHRRHLDESQRALIAVDAERNFSADAKERQKRKPADSVTAPAQRQNGSAAEYAAKLVGVGVRSIYSAKKVHKDGAPEVYQAVRDGHLSVKVAERLVRAVPDKTAQTKILGDAVDPNRETRRNDRRIKSRIEQVKQASEPRPEPTRRPEPVEIEPTPLEECIERFRIEMDAIAEYWPPEYYEHLVGELRKFTSKVEADGGDEPPDYFDLDEAIDDLRALFDRRAAQWPMDARKKLVHFWKQAANERACDPTWMKEPTAREGVS